MTRVDRDGDAESNLVHSTGRRWIVAFVGLSYGGTWLLVLPIVLGGDPTRNPVLLVGYLLGAFVPSMAAVTLVWRDGGIGSVHSLVGRITRYRVGVRWYVAAVALPLVLKGFVLASLLLFGYPRPAVPELSMWPTVLAVAVIGGLFPGAVGEELGWRGFALPRL